MSEGKPEGLLLKSQLDEILQPIREVEEIANNNDSVSLTEIISRIDRLKKSVRDALDLADKKGK